MSLAEEITYRLQSLEPTVLILKDDSHLHVGHAGNQGGGHFELEIESDHFSGKSMVMRHRLIYQHLQDLMPARIHALSIRATASDDNKL